MNPERDFEKLIQKGERQGGFSKGQLNRLKNITKRIIEEPVAKKSGWQFWLLGLISHLLLKFT